jgi:hypothetical protein
MHPFTGTFVRDPVYAGDRLLERLSGLIARARAGSVPVIYVPQRIIDEHNAKFAAFARMANAADIAFQ